MEPFNIVFRDCGTISKILTPTGEMTFTDKALASLVLKELHAAYDLGAAAKVEEMRRSIQGVLSLFEE